MMFRFEGAMLGAVTVAMPMLYLPAKAGFAAVNRDLEGRAAGAAAALTVVSLVVIILYNRSGSTLQRASR